MSTGFTGNTWKPPGLPGTIERRSMPPLTPKTGLPGHAVRLAIVVLALILCYLWGLNSLFLFDDNPNLDALAYIRDASPLSPDFWEFVLGGQAGPTGRPFALFTFALQAGAWPDNPLAFKAVNLAVHCLNASLVYLISMRLISRLQGDRKASGTPALLIALAWALHPVHASTVLYAVQRMALLSNFFMLLAIHFYLVLRQEAATGGSARQLVRLTLAIAVPGLFALLSKENAPSLVFYLLVLEYTLLHDGSAGPSPSRAFRRWRLVCLWLPAAVVLLLPLVFMPAIQADYDRNFTFTPWQRLLTESRVLWSYLGTLVLPRLADTGIFHDVVISTSPTRPITTLVAILAWLGCFVLAWFRPGRHRVAAFALCWFFAGHLIESTILPLEPFFHHRNYLAFYGVVFTVVYAFYRWLPATTLPGKSRLLVCSLYIALLALNTFQASRYWSEPLALAERWYEGDPATGRNAEFYAIQLASQGDVGEQLAAHVFSQAIGAREDNFRLQLDLMTLACANPAVKPPAADAILTRAGSLSPGDRDLVSPVRQLVTLHLNGHCPVYDRAFFDALLERLAGASTGHDRGMFQFDRARLRLNEGRREEAMALLERAWENTGDPGILFNQALQLVNAGRYADALSVIDLAMRETRDHNDIRTGTRSSKLAALQDMRRDVQALAAGNIEATNSEQEP